jgi:DNA-binding response OmpR family regulator
VSRILVVDDDADIRRVLTSILVEEGHRVASAYDGQNAMEMLHQEMPDLVILDVMMPRLDGFDVLKQMKTQGIRDQTRVLLLTAKSSEHDWARGYKLGADLYLTKPFGIEELLEAVNSVLALPKDQLKEKRAAELSKAQLLSKLESIFDDV